MPFDFADLEASASCGWSVTFDGELIAWFPDGMKRHADGLLRNLPELDGKKAQVLPSAFVGMIKTGSGK